MCFKGTPSLPTARDILVEYDTIGAYFNAYTEKQYTCYVAKFHSSYTRHSLAILSDILLHSHFNKKEYEKEMNVVIEENVRNQTDYDNDAHDLVESMVYKGSVYEHPVDHLRYHPNVNAWKYDDVISFYRKNYVPQNMVLSIVSTIPFKRIIEYVKHTHFAKHSRKSTIEPILNTVPQMIYDKQRGLQVELKHIPDIQTAYVIVSFRTCNLYSDDVHSLDVLRAILGATFTSRMFTILREKNGLTYTSRVITKYYENAGDIRFVAITDSAKLLYNQTTRDTRKHRGPKAMARRKKGVLPLIIGMIRDLIQHGVSEKELSETKQYLRGKQLLNMEDAETQVDYNGKQLFLHNTPEIDPYRSVYEKHIAPITCEDIRRVIARYFKSDNMNVAMVGGKLVPESAIRKVCEL
jgi:predicted Zn-dependent peptidase